MCKITLQVRAIRRAGELLKQIEPAANRYGNSSGMGDHTSSRADAAREAGMSKHQYIQIMLPSAVTLCHALKSKIVWVFEASLKKLICRIVGSIIRRSDL
jgi:hypothetical protein